VSPVPLADANALLQDLFPMDKMAAQQSATDGAKPSLAKSVSISATPKMFVWMKMAFLNKSTPVSLVIAFVGMSALER
jgi:uncharacterized membrane-anchored protein